MSKWKNHILLYLLNVVTFLYSFNNMGASCHLYCCSAQHIRWPQQTVPFNCRRIKAGLFRLLIKLGIISSCAHGCSKHWKDGFVPLFLIFGITLIQSTMVPQCKSFGQKKVTVSIRMHTGRQANHDSSTASLSYRPRPV